MLETIVTCSCSFFSERDVKLLPLLQLHPLQLLQQIQTATPEFASRAWRPHTHLMFDLLQVVLDERYPELGQLLLISLPLLTFLRLLALLPLQRRDPLHRHVRCRQKNGARYGTRTQDTGVEVQTSEIWLVRED